MFTKKFIIGVLAVGFFAVTAIALPTMFSNNLQFETAVVSAFGGGPGGEAGGGGNGGGGACGGCGGGETGDPGGGNNEPTTKCLYLRANGQTGAVELPAGGGNVTLNWATQGAYEVAINNGVGNVPVNGSETVNVTDDTTFTLTATGNSNWFGYTTDSCEVEVVVPDPTPQPKCDFINVTPSNLPYGGGNVSINWGTTNADTVTLNGTTVSADGSTTRNVTNDTTFTLVVSNAAGSVNCSDSVHVEGYTPNPRCDFFSIAASEVTPGQSFAINWGTTDVTNTSINQGVGSVAVDGPKTVTAPNTPGIYEYVLTFDGKTSHDCRDTIKVVPDHPALSCSDLVFTASDTLVTPGSNVTLSWVWTGNVTGATVNQGIGAVNSGDTRVVTINNQTTYTTTITNGTDSKQCPLSIKVKEITPICQGVSFSASDTSVDEGDRVTLDWSWTQNYDEVRITNGIGVVNNNDSEEVRINDDESYAIVVTRGNDSETCKTININAKDDGGGGGGSVAPRCEEFEASDDSIRPGERVTLEWETRFASEVTLFEGDDDDGDELFNTDDDDEVDDGEFVVRPTEDTMYTLLVERGSKDRTCRVKIEVDEDDDVVVLTDRNQEPRVAGIALTQVPYTGFEAGPTLTVLFYILLAIWGLFVAYTFTVKRDRVLGFSLAGAFPRKQSVVDASTDTTDAEEESVAAAYVASTTAPAAVPANLPTGIAPTIGYAAVADTKENETHAADASDTEDTLGDLENRAHAHYALFSSDALRYFAESHSLDEQFSALDDVITQAKKRFPSEDGWVVINLERLQTLMDVTDVVPSLDETPTTTGSLAEAVASGNAAAALAMIGNRPMIALADATTDFDALYRQRNGGDETVSDLLASASAHLTDAQISEVIHAFNSAMDGTYASETDAVKTAILKAITITS